MPRRKSIRFRVTTLRQEGYRACHHPIRAVMLDLNRRYLGREINTGSDVRVPVKYVCATCGAVDAGSGWEGGSIDHPYRLTPQGKVIC